VDAYSSYPAAGLNFRYALWKQSAKELEEKEKALQKLFGGKKDKSSSSSSSSSSPRTIVLNAERVCEDVTASSYCISSANGAGTGAERFLVEVWAEPESLSADTTSPSYTDGRSYAHTLKDTPLSRSSVVRASADEESLLPVHLPLELPCDTSSSVVQPADPSRSWAERLHSAHWPLSAFVFEVSFPPTGSLGLSLNELALSSPNSPHTAVSGVVVANCSNSLLGVVLQPGDIILKVNETSLMHPTKDFNFLTQIGLLKQSPGGDDDSSKSRVLHFLRPVSGSSFPSPAELSLFKDASPVATFTVTPSGTGSSVVLQIRQDYIDPDTTPAIKRQMQGLRVRYEDISTPIGYFESQLLVMGHKPGKMESGQIQGALGVRPTGNYKELHESERHRAVSYGKRCRTQPALLSSGTGVGTGGVVRDRGKFSAEIYAGSGALGGTHFLGRYESEEDAVIIHRRAAEELTKTGGFVGKRFKLGSHMYQRNPETVPVLQPFTGSTHELYMGFRQATYQLLKPTALPNPATQAQ
jgi:hypothetical protein